MLLVERVFRVGCPSCYVTFSDKAQNGTQSLWWPGFNLSSFTTKLLMEGALLSIPDFCDATTTN